MRNTNPKDMIYHIESHNLVIDLQHAGCAPLPFVQALLMPFIYLIVGIIVN